MGLTLWVPKYELLQDMRKITRTLQQLVSALQRAVIRARGQRSAGHI